MQIGCKPILSVLVSVSVSVSVSASVNTPLNIENISTVILYINVNVTINNVLNFDVDANAREQSL